MGMQQLIRPGGMGDFQMMFQAKGAKGPKRIEAAELWGLEASPEADALLDGLSPPRLTSEHVPLLEASYPHLAQTYEYLWPRGEAT